MAITINDAALFVRWLRGQGREVEELGRCELLHLYQRYVRMR